jgi:GH15 family glucan-1,4-alpha-glucosidase
MPRDLPLSNGSLLVAFDLEYRIRDVYSPHVGMENHAADHLTACPTCGHAPAASATAAAR